jgi:hypothetical protein
LTKSFHGCTSRRDFIYCTGISAPGFNLIDKTAACVYARVYTPKI